MSGLPRSIPNANQNSGIDPTADQFRSKDPMNSALICNDLSFLMKKKKEK